MLSETSGTVDDATLDASTLFASDANEPLNCKTIVRSAAFATGSGIGVFFRGTWNKLEVAARYGGYVWNAIPASDVLIPRLAALKPGELLIIEDVVSLNTKRSDDVSSEAFESIRFLVAAPVFNAKKYLLGVLIVADVYLRSGLSKAQEYVIRTHAAQLGSMMDFQALRRQIRVQITGDTERLRLLESVVVNANDAVLITEAEPIDLPGPRIVYCNRAFEKTTGYSEAEVLGKTPRMLQADRVDRTSLTRLKNALANWQPVEVELLNRRKDGTEFWVELSIVPVANEKGWYTHWVSVQRDVSDRKKSEEIATRARIAEAENKVLEAEILERKRVEAQLLYEAFHDHLTKLRNRAYFMDRLAVSLEAARERLGLSNTVLFLDLDGFKLVNDSLGHRAGDHLLMVTAGRLLDCIRPEDVLARIGGDEFAVLLQGGNLSAGIGVAERIINALRVPVMIGNQRVFPSCSIGIAQSGDGLLKPDEFLRNADIAMYEAKKSDLGGYAVFKNSMHQDVSDALALRMDLRQAIVREEFRIFFQLICDPATSHITGVEALVRWQHPTRGLISPLAFVPIAEEIGAIRSIGRWVLRMACEQLSSWNVRFPSLALRMNVNVSGDELRDPEFVSELLSILRKTGVDAKQLQLEVTESVFLRQPDLIGAVLETIRATGVRIALDDFGTGFSSLSYIDQYPIDAIKIDRSFVARMLSHRRTLAIIETIIRLGDALDLQIVAEGVETDAQREMLTTLRCSHVQGYLFAMPMPAEETTAAIAYHDENWSSGALSLQRQLSISWA